VCCVAKRKRRTVVEDRVRKKNRVNRMRRQSQYGMSLCPIQRSREPKLSSVDSSRSSRVPGIGGVPKPRIEMLWVCKY
jgi:hypothetical protein